MVGNQVTTIDDNMIDESGPVPVSSASSLDSYLAGFPNFDLTGEIAALSSSEATSAPVLLPGGSTGNSVPEFLYQLTKMLTDDNREVIEWSNGTIEVHNPRRLETDVLHKYFRHSKFASFQRQLNYFGFRKLAGKGKMAPCSYVNEAVTGELGSLLRIKRKTNTTPREKGGKVSKKKGMTSKKSQQPQATTAPAVFNSIRKNNTGITTNLTENSSQEDIARSAVGKGIRYSFEARERALSLSAAGPATAALDDSRSSSREANSLSAVLGSSYPEDSLSELANNFRNSLKEVRGETATSPARRGNEMDPTPLSQLRNNNVSPFGSGVLTGFLSRNSSLVDLAMIPDVEDMASPKPQPQQQCHTEDTTIGFDSALSFVDFPHPEVHPEVHPSSLTAQPNGVKTMEKDDVG